MHELDYVPDQDIEIHEEGAIRLICAAFQTHEAGLPEWVKNSADAYARSDTQESDRQIIVFLQDATQSRPASISVLDFAGMSSGEIENNFRRWADPDAAKRGIAQAEIQGGHGNGGKCYMTQMFEQHSRLLTVKEGLGNHYGVAGRSIRFGYIPDRERGRDYSVPDLRAELGEALSRVGCSVRSLPEAAVLAMTKAKGFTLVTGVGPIGLGKKLPSQRILQDLEEHPQMIRTLELCSVFVVSNGRIQNNGAPLNLPSIPPIDGVEEPRIIEIPDELTDPRTNTKLSTTENALLPKGQLRLLTSKVSMRYSKKGRHNIVIRAQSGYIGFIQVSELDVQSSFRDRIYGDCALESLEGFKLNDRSRLADSPLTRAVQALISQEVEKYAKMFEAQEKRKYNQEERSAISRMNEALDKWKNQFLKEYMRGLWGAGQDGPVDPPPNLPTGKAARMEIAVSHNRAGLGVSFRPTIRFWEASGRQVRPVPFEWVSDDTNIALVDKDLQIVNTYSYGLTHISARTYDGKLQSNSVPLEVVQIHEVEVHPAELELVAGSRGSLNAVCTLADNSKTSDIYLIWTEGDSRVARVSAAGLVYGFSQGVTEVVAGDDHLVTKSPATINVIQGDGKGPGKERGKGFPVVLVSGIDPDPETNEIVEFSTEDPPVWQRPQDADRNIWWINSSAPLARLYLRKEIGYGYDAREWRMYHLERYIDVIVQIAIVNSPRDQAAMSANDWLLEWGSQVAQVQMAAASDLTGFIDSGQLPG